MKANKCTNYSINKFKLTLRESLFESKSVKKFTNVKNKKNWYMKELTLSIL